MRVPAQRGARTRYSSRGLRETESGFFFDRSPFKPSTTRVSFTPIDHSAIATLSSGSDRRRCDAPRGFLPSSCSLAFATVFLASTFLSAEVPTIIAESTQRAPDACVCVTQVRGSSASKSQRAERRRATSACCIDDHKLRRLGTCLGSNDDGYDAKKAGDNLRYRVESCVGLMTASVSSSTFVASKVASYARNFDFKGDGLGIVRGWPWDHMCMCM